MDLGISGKVAIVTGGNSGIGKATAELLVREGAKVVLLDRTLEDSQKVAAELEPWGEVISVQADLTQLEDVEAARNQILERFETVHILVHAAGITGATGDFLTLSDQDWEKVIAIDLMGAVRVCRAFIPAMRSTGWGRVVLISSEDGMQPYPEDLPYCACKAAILNLAKGLSKAYAKDGVLVNSVSPAFVASPMTDAMMEKRAEEMRTSTDDAIASFLNENRPHIELKRRGKAEEVANVIGFLCSERSSFVIGSNYRVDGGSVPSL
ncbi:MAG TPA: SDR family oxidoreductase [Leptolyngbya sp.]|jgi:NAD(P)-dependent dehydrogenase (short-subunit alcohol dehydrogenase family)|nr:SDR family oxidoreductase [Leptolyngbya sp.]